MKLPTRLVAVKKINSLIPNSRFPTEDIEKAARLILDAEGIIDPIILKRNGLEAYEVVDGHFEYYAALRAREIDLLKGEMIQAIILEPENEEILLEQVRMLRNRPPVPISTPNSLEVILTNLEKVFQSKFEELRQESRNQVQTLSETLNQIQNNFLFLKQEDLIDKIVDRVITGIKPITTNRSRHKKTIEELKQNPLDLNAVSEDALSTVPKIGPKTASSIVQMRKKKGKFTRLEELAEIQGISKDMIKREKWDQCFVIE